MKLARVYRLSALLLACSVSPAVGKLQLASHASERIELRSNFRIPDAEGLVDISRTGDRTELAVELDDLKPANLFGGDYNTYVLWAVSGCNVENLGEISLQGDHSSLLADTGLERFSILVTAEPHRLVSTPSTFIVLNSITGAEATYPNTTERYNYERDTLAGVTEASGAVDTEVQQAWTAVRLAQRSGASQYAKAELARAETALDATIKVSQEGSGGDVIENQARETVRLAVEAQHLAGQRKRREALDSERKVDRRNDTERDSADARCEATAVPISKR